MLKEKLNSPEDTDSWYRKVLRNSVKFGYRTDRQNAKRKTHFSIVAHQNKISAGDRRLACIQTVKKIENGVLHIHLLFIFLLYAVSYHNVV